MKQLADLDEKYKLGTWEVVTRERMRVANKNHRANCNQFSSPLPAAPPPWQVEVQAHPTSKVTFRIPSSALERQPGARPQDTHYNTWKTWRFSDDL